MGRTLIRLIIVGVVLALFCGRGQAATYIDSIHFVGNEVTQPSVMLREMYITEGDEVDLAKIEASAQAIMDLGLFRNVSYYLQEDYLAADIDLARAELVIVVEEKYYWLLIPRLRVRDNEWRYGVQLRWDNLRGLNHRMRLETERVGEEEGVTEYKKRFSYTYPYALGSQFSLKTTYTDQNNVEANTSGVLQNQLEQTFDLRLHRWWQPERSKQGRYIQTSLAMKSRKYEELVSQLIVDESDAVIVSAEYGFQNVHEYLYNRGGKHYGYQLDVSHHSLGSSSEFVRHRLFYQSYYRFKSRPLDNLNVRGLLAHATDLVLGDYAYTLDYRNGLRGYERDRYQGNTLLLLNTEYLMPSGTYPTLRYLYFIDIGSTYEQAEDIAHEPLKVGLGMGIRWKIPAFVNVDVRIDLGYGVADQDTQISLGASHLF